MGKLIDILISLRKLFLTVAETGLSLVALIVMFYLLLGGESGNFVLSVMANISLAVDAISPQAIIAAGLVFGLIAVLKNRD